MCCGVVWCGVVWCGAVRCGAVWSVVLCCVVLCCAMLRCVVFCSVELQSIVVYGAAAGQLQGGLHDGSLQLHNKFSVAYADMSQAGGSQAVKPGLTGNPD